MAGLFDGPVNNRLPEGFPVPTAAEGQSQGMPEAFLPKLLEATIDPLPSDPSLS